MRFGRKRLRGLSVEANGDPAAGRRPNAKMYAAIRMQLRPDRQAPLGRSGDPRCADLHGGVEEAEGGLDLVTLLNAAGLLRDQSTSGLAFRSATPLCDLSPGRNRHRDQGSAAEQQIDPDEEAECPGERAGKPGDDDRGENEVDDPADQHPLPAAR